MANTIMIPDPSTPEDALFKVGRLRSRSDHVAGYFIESTAPNNVDPPETEADKAGQPADGVDWIDDKNAIRDIASTLRELDSELVVLIHGFSTPRQAALMLTSTAFAQIQDDPAMNRRPRTVFIGYRWPSERLGTPFFSTFKAAPG